MEGGGVEGDEVDCCDGVSFWMEVTDGTGRGGTWGTGIRGVGGNGDLKEITLRIEIM